jgi:hypothetical protein
VGEDEEDSAALVGGGRRTGSGGRAGHAAARDGVSARHREEAVGGGVCRRDVDKVVVMDKVGFSWTVRF